MFRAVRRRLTVVCTACTLLVLVGMAGAALAVSLNRLARQSEDSFSADVNAALFYLGAAGVVDHAWLAQTEAAGGLYIRVESAAGQTLGYTGLDEKRERLSASARAFGEEQYGFYSRRRASGTLAPEIETFTIGNDSDGLYRVAMCYLPRSSGEYFVTILKTMGEETAARRVLWWAFGLAAGAGGLLLALFAWLFTGRALRPAEAAVQAQNAFLSAASHELRSPLAVIRLSAGTLKKAPAEAPVYAEKIEAECGRMARLLEDLLLLAGSDAGLRLRGGEASPKTLLLTAYERFEALAAGKGVRLEPGLPDTPLPAVCWDVGRVEQALAVLLDNALHYTPAGGLVRLELRPAKGGIAFTVADSGPGIPDSEKPHVFTRFYRADAARSDKNHYGLGLSVACEIARLHGGRLTVEDADLGGAAFTLWLPPEIPAPIAAGRLA